MFDLSTTQLLLGLVSGALVGMSLGLIGGGGSILAVPLMMYVVGGVSPHVTIGTSAVAVAANAASNLIKHHKSGNVKWPCALTFAVAGVIGAIAGSSLGKAVDGEHLLALFAVLMVVVAFRMLVNRHAAGRERVRLDRQNTPKLIAFGLATGAVSGFFGIGGGFLIVPALMAATGMPIIQAVGSSLVAVTLFGLSTSANYAISGLVNVSLALVFISGGVVGGWVGARGATHLAATKGLLNSVFAVVIMLVAAYMLYRSLHL